LGYGVICSGHPTRNLSITDSSSRRLFVETNSDQGSLHKDLMLEKSLLRQTSATHNFGAFRAMHQKLRCWMSPVLVRPFWHHNGVLYEALDLRTLLSMIECAPQRGSKVPNYKDDAEI
jgi:hypothetical protein